MKFRFLLDGLNDICSGCLFDYTCVVFAFGLVNFVMKIPIVHIITLAVYHCSFSARLCRYDAIRSVQMLGSPVQVQILTIAECEELCERWETLPFTSSVCVGFNYENSIGICSLYDTQSSFGTNLNYDFYERRCAERNLTGD